jgi:hypothetical protein
MSAEVVKIRSYPSDSFRGDWSQSAILGDRDSGAREFADIVASQIVGTVLPWSQRESLVRLAELWGIRRFDANLIIAAVQHQMGIGRKRVESQARRRSLWQIAASAAVFVIVQAGIVGVVWHWLF